MRKLCLAVLAIVLGIGTVPMGLAQTVAPNRQQQCDESCCTEAVTKRPCCCPHEEAGDPVTHPEGPAQPACECSVRSGSDHDLAVLPAAPPPSLAEVILTAPALPEFRASAPCHEPAHLLVPLIRDPEFPYPGPRAPPVR